MTEEAGTRPKRRPDRESAARPHRGPRRRCTPPTARSRPMNGDRLLEARCAHRADRPEVPKPRRADGGGTRRKVEKPRTQDENFLLAVLPNGSALSCERR